MRYVLVFLLGLLPAFVWSGQEPVSTLVPSKQIYDKGGTPIRSFLSKNKTYYQPVSLAEISPWLVAAAVAAEDKRFFSHVGVDAQAILRALWQNTKKGTVSSGASTITQQLVRAVHPRPKTLWGKANEAWEALLLERKKTKEEILEEYFNLIEFGNLTQGVEAASRYYFGTGADGVSLSQAAFLMGIVKSPTRYNPLKHFKRAISRRNYVLKRMKAEGVIDEELYQMALTEEFSLQKQARPFEAPHFTAFLVSLLPQQASIVFSTLDGDLQDYAEQVIKNHLSRLQQGNVTNAAVVVLENQSGAVLAYVGSGNFYDDLHQGQVDGARALRQPGSALKPFVYGWAFEHGMLTPASLLLDKDTFFEGGFRPRNYDETYHGEVSARTALASSYNVPAVKVAEQVGAGNLLTFLTDIGLTSLSKPADFYGLGLALGNGEIRLLDLTNAYASLARGGIFQPVLMATDPLIHLPGKRKRILSEETAYLLTDILADNDARAPAFGLNSPLYTAFPFAAKTGTSKDYKDNFAMGYTPRWTVGVWVGNFDASSMQKVSGITGAAPILHDIAVYLQEKYPAAAFSVPNGVLRALVCEESGLLAGPSCSHTREDVFLKRSLPKFCDGKHLSKKDPVQIVSPKPGDVYQYDPSLPKDAQQLKISGSCPSGEECRWKLNGVSLPGSCSLWWPLSPGKQKIELFCASQSRELLFEVLP